MSAGKEIRPGVYPPVSTKTKLKIILNAIFRPSKPVISYYREGLKGVEDPLFNFKYTLRFMRIFRHKRIQLFGEFVVPLFFSIGDNDELFTVESAQELFNEIPSKNKAFYVMPGGTHTEFPEGSLNQLISWLERIFN